MDRMERDAKDGRGLRRDGMAARSVLRRARRGVHLGVDAVGIDAGHCGGLDASEHGRSFSSAS